MVHWGHATARWTLISSSASRCVSGAGRSGWAEAENYSP
jgi:hypothetical protein